MNKTLSLIFKDRNRLVVILTSKNFRHPASLFLPFNLKYQFKKQN